jgi:hypothetical protein
MQPKLQIAAWTAFILVVLAWIVFWLIPFASKSNELGKADKADRVTFDCDRGLRATDWRTDRLMTAQSIAKCDWLDGKSRDQVTKALGAPDKTEGTALSQWNVGKSAGSNGGGKWVLTLTYDATTGNVSKSVTQTLRI